MKNIFIYFFLCAVTFLNCNNNNKGRSSKESVSDNALKYNKLPQNIKGYILSQNSLWNVMIENIYFSLYDCENSYCYLIKEFGEDSIEHFFYIQDKVPYNRAEYDSLDYDNLIFVKLNMEGKLTYADSLSWKYFNINELRKNDILFQKYFLDFSKSIIQVEEIINRMDVFKKFSYKNEFQMSILKRILFQLRISSLNFEKRNYQFMTSQLMDFKNIGEINTNDELDSFIIDIETFKYNKDELVSYWQYINYQFICTKYSFISSKLKDPGTFILYTKLPETKFFIYNISLHNDKIRIKELYLNKDFYWYHPLFGVPIPGYRI
jgi:hypothetical protein